MSHDAAAALAVGRLQDNDPQYGGGMTGHTAGGMSWTWRSCEQDRCLNIVYADSLSAVSGPDYRYADDMADVLRSSIERLAEVDCDILLSTHAANFRMHQKLKQGRAAFVDEHACERYAGWTRAALDRRLGSEKQGSREVVSTSPD